MSNLTPHEWAMKTVTDIEAKKKREERKKLEIERGRKAATDYSCSQALLNIGRRTHRKNGSRVVIPYF